MSCLLSFPNQCFKALLGFAWGWTLLERAKQSCDAHYHLWGGGVVIGACTLPQYVTSWDKISHMSQTFHMELTTPVLCQIQCFKMVKITSQYRVCVQSN